MATKQAQRAMQVWMVLIACAHDRRTITYDDLGTIIFGKQAAGIWAGILGRILRYCERQHLPPLTCLVVNATRGKPGAGGPQGTGLERERVYRAKWYARPPVQIIDFEESKGEQS